jgi:hypothetical protein
MRNLQVNGERLWAGLMELAKIDATPKGAMRQSLLPISAVRPAGGAPKFPPRP